MEYYIFMNTDIVSPVQLQPQNLTILQNYINFTAPGNSLYVIANVASMTSLDYKFSFALHVKSEVRVNDYSNFQAAIIAVWNETRGEKCCLLLLYIIGNFSYLLLKMITVIQYMHI